MLGGSQEEGGKEAHEAALTGAAGQAWPVVAWRLVLGSLKRWAKDFPSPHTLLFPVIMLLNYLHAERSCDGLHFCPGLSYLYFSVLDPQPQRSPVREGAGMASAHT